MSRVGLRRLGAQRVGAAPHGTVEDVVRALLAVQAQDPLAARWAVGVRRGGTEADVIDALDRGVILRTHVMRGTWQYVTPDDLPWLLSLLGPRVRQSAERRHRELALTPAVLTKAEGVVERALSARGAALDRDEVRAVLEGAGVSTEGQRLSHLLIELELRAVICSGPHRDGKATWAAFSQRVPRVKATPRDEALATLAQRFFESRGPASVDDLRWWSGLTAADTKAALGLARPRLEEETVGGRVLYGPKDSREAAPGLVLLPAFDEFLIGYANRDDVLDPTHVARINAGGGLLAPVIVEHGRVVGTWRRELDARAGATVDFEWFAKPTKAQTSAALRAAAAWATFSSRVLCE